MDSYLMSPSLDTLEWHLAHNFYPPYVPQLAVPCQLAISAILEGFSDRIIPINGHTEIDGEPLTAEKLADDFRLFSYLNP